MKIKNFKLKISKYNPSKIEEKWPHFAKASRGKQPYDPGLIEKKWQQVWEKNKVYSPDLDKAKKSFYNLMMFPYPSAEGMHVGNMYAFTGSDIYGRFKRMQGFDVFEPIGLDGFGIHSENYAIKVGHHPKEQAKISEANFYRQLHATGNGFDWSRTVETYDPEYYKWTQWIFIQLFKAGLAYRKKAPVNFCPSCKTVLADEQVIDGKCERCSSIAEKKNLEQWFFKITTYADRLLNNLKDLDWTPKVKIAQRQWIGKSEGMEISFPVILNTSTSLSVNSVKDLNIQIFTVFPETIFGVTYMVLAPEHNLVQKLTTGEHKKEVDKYIKDSQNKSEIERTTVEKEKTGVFTGSYCINPANSKEIPVWVADYVIGSYGTGAVMGVPGSDHRDFEFAKRYKLSIIRVIGNTSSDRSSVESEKDVLEEGFLVNSGQFSGLVTPQPAKEKIKDWIEKEGFGKRRSEYHLRDWLISRQRYWGPPIPMIFCEKCNWQPVPDRDLPVLLPDVKDWKPKGTGKSPLASVPSFVKTNCPLCKGPARRETDVSDTFLDSAWYFFRYTSTEDKTCAWSPERVKKWLPVNMYIGGAEHSVLHLLYSRFLTMVFKDLGLISFEEPFTTFRAHGLLISGGAKMSKSKGNVVIPDQYIKKYGADTLRAYLMFAGPYEQGGDFIDTGIEGMHKFLKRVWTLSQNVILSKAKDPVRDSSVVSLPQNDIGRMMHKTIKKVTEDIENLHYNTAISALMEYYNEISNIKYQISKREIEVLVLLLAPFAPHMSEELYQLFGNSKFEIRNSKFSSVHLHPWPSYDPRMLEEDEATIVVQVNGKVRITMRVQSSKFKVQSYVEEKARESERVKKYLEGKTVKKVVYVEGKIVNFVTD